MRIGQLTPLISAHIESCSYLAFELDVKPEEIVDGRFVEIPRLTEKIRIERWVGAAEKTVIAIDT